MTSSEKRTTLTTISVAVGIIAGAAAFVWSHDDRAAEKEKRIVRLESACERSQKSDEEIRDALERMATDIRSTNATVTEILFRLPKQGDRR